jgi:hypothetical protein
MKGKGKAKSILTPFDSVPHVNDLQTTTPMTFNTPPQITPKDNLLVAGVSLFHPLECAFSFKVPRVQSLCPLKWYQYLLHPRNKIKRGAGCSNSFQTCSKDRCMSLVQEIRGVFAACDHFCLQCEKEQEEDRQTVTNLHCMDWKDRREKRSRNMHQWINVRWDTFLGQKLRRD